MEANPLTLLSEQMLAALYHNHPYGRPGARLGARDEQTVAPGRGDLLPALLRPQQCRSGGGRRCHAGGGPAAGAGDLRRATSPIPRPCVGRGRRSLRRSPRAVCTLEDARAGATVLAALSMPCRASRRLARTRQKVSSCWPGSSAAMTPRACTGGSCGKLAATAGMNYVGNGLDSGRLAFVVIPFPGFRWKRPRPSSMRSSTRCARRASRRRNWTVPSRRSGGAPRCSNPTTK